MDNTSSKQGFVFLIIFIAIVIVTGIFVWEDGNKSGYEKLEREIVYGIAGDKNRRVGNFLISKHKSGGTMIFVNESPFVGGKGREK